MIISEAGAIAFRPTGDPAVGEVSDAIILGRYGDTLADLTSFTSVARPKAPQPITPIPRAAWLDLPIDLARCLDAWIIEKPEPRPDRREAIRIALRDWLTGLGQTSSLGLFGRFA